jgi:hypothetical protein
LNVDPQKVDDLSGIAAEKGLIDSEGNLTEAGDALILNPVKRGG